MTLEKLKTYREGRLTYVNAVRVGGVTITIHGSIFRTARVHDEWFNTVEDPLEISRLLRRQKLADLLTFSQLLPDTVPRYDLPMESVPISALPIASYEHWSTHQIRKEVRKNIRKAERRGVEIRRVEFDDNLVVGMTAIFNEAKMRQGRPFWHYGKGIQEVREEMGQDLGRSDFIGAYFENDLIGFYKLIAGRNFLQPVVSLSMLKHRDKYTDTALIAEAVRFCAERGLQYLTYGEWRRESHKEFLEAHGFKKFLLPRYYVPLTHRGSMLLTLGLHKGVKGLLKTLPEPVLRELYALRTRWHLWHLGITRDQDNIVSEGRPDGQRRDELEKVLRSD